MYHGGKYRWGADTELRTLLLEIRLPHHLILYHKIQKGVKENGKASAVCETESDGRYGENRTGQDDYGELYPETGERSADFGAELGGNRMTECVRNTIVVGGIFLIMAIPLAIEWIREEMRK